MERIIQDIAQFTFDHSHLQHTAKLWYNESTEGFDAILSGKSDFVGMNNFEFEEVVFARVYFIF